MYPDRVRAASLAGVWAAGLLAGCSRPAPPPPPPAPPARPAPVEQPTPLAVPTPPAPLGRGELLDAVAAAADAYAAGRPLPANAKGLAGRSFRLSLPFGCFGQPAAEPGVGYDWRERVRTLKLSAAPQVWTQDPAVRGLVGDAATEALEGFWLRRPWLRGEDCPAHATPASPDAARSPETVGLVSVSGRDDSRLQKRARRPYEITRKLTADERPSEDGYRLVLAGRIGGDETHPPIACGSPNPEQRPTCFVRMALDRVAFETADGGQLAEWGG